MTTPEDLRAFTDHPLWTDLTDVLAELRNARPRSDIDRATINRARTTLSYVKKFAQVPPELFTASRVAHASELQTYARQIRSQIQGWDQDSAMNPNSVANIDSICDQILVTVTNARWPALQNPLRSEVHIEAARGYVDTAEASLAALKASVDAATTVADAAVTAANSALSTAEVARTEADTTIANFVEEQTTVTEEWKVAHTTAVEAVAVAATKQRDYLSKLAEGQRQEFENRAKESLESLSTDAETGQELVRRVGDQARAGGYHKFANKERWAYRLWIATGILAVIGTLAYLGLELREISQTEKAPDLALMLLKTGLSVTAIAFSGFCFREAGKRQRNAIEAHYRALDLLALDPFTEGMEDVEATAFRRLLGERIFGSAPDPAPRRSDEKVTTLRLDLGDIKALADTAKAVRDVVPPA